jgi:hypothetical protein
MTPAGLQVVFVAKQSANVKIVLADAQGRALIARTIAVPAGQRSIMLPCLDVARGTYILTASSEGVRTTRKVVAK